MQRPWIPLYIGDYLRDTAHLDATCHGAYLLLLFFCWCKSSAPDDDEQLSAIARCSVKEWTERVGPVVRPFFRAEGGRLYQGRLDREAKKSTDLSEKRRKAALSRKTAADRRKIAGSGGGEQQPNSKSPAKGQQTASKTRANGEQTASKSLANDEQTVVTVPGSGEQLLHVQPQPHPQPQSEAAEGGPSAAAAAPAAAPKPEIDVVVEAWNAMAHDAGLPGVRSMVGARCKPVRARLAEHGLDGALLVIAMVGQSGFLHRGRDEWQASFDWLMAPVNFAKVLDGNYAYDRQTAPKPSYVDEVRDFVHGARARAADTHSVDSKHWNVAPEAQAQHLRIPGDD